jgi:hypothetical protein
LLHNTHRTPFDIIRKINDHLFHSVFFHCVLLTLFFNLVVFLLAVAKWRRKKRRRVYVISLNCFIVRTYLRWAVNITHTEINIRYKKSWKVRREWEERKEKCIIVVVKCGYNVSHFMLIQQHHCLPFFAVSDNNRMCWFFFIVLEFLIFFILCNFYYILFGVGIITWSACLVIKLLKWNCCIVSCYCFLLWLWLVYLALNGSLLSQGMIICVKCFVAVLCQRLELKTAC